MSDRRRCKTAQALPTINPAAAGVDIGATEIYVAVPSDRDSESVRSFGAFTEDLFALADWLGKCGVKTVAMESTGVYWIPLFQVLEERGFEVYLVNARHVKGVPGRKSDVQDCQWIQYLHSVGLLQGSFRPSDDVCAIRTVIRHRESLIRMAASHVQHMQKALSQMNLQLHNVISDLTGVTGLAILDAILSGERDPAKLAELRHRRIKASSETIAKSLVGDYRREHLFTLGQALETYRYYQCLISRCDAEIEAMLNEMDVVPDSAAPPPLPGSKHNRKPRGNEPQFDIRAALYPILGLDLTEVPGISTGTLQTIFSEIGRDISRFPSGKHFASWLGLCPDNRVSGGRVLSARTRDVKSRAAYALRLAAQALQRSQSALGDYFRRMKARLGTQKAITAAAHKLARIIYHLLTTRQPYDQTFFAQNDQLHLQRMERKLRRQAATLGYELVPRQPALASPPSVS